MLYNDHVITKEDIKAWLKETGQNRQHLANTVGVSKGTVNNWLSGADPIPFAKLQLIERIINESEEKQVETAPVKPEEITAIAIVMTKEQRAYLTMAAGRLGLTLDQFIIQAGVKRAEGILGKFDQQTSSAG